MPRFPFGIGKSWYPIAYTDEVPLGASLPLRYFDLDLLLSRDAAGRLSLTDAATTRSWRLHEDAGLISAWYHPQDAGPDFALPPVAEWGDPEWAESWWKLRWTVRTHPQEMRENAIDWVHFRFVHGGSDLPATRGHAFDGPRMRFSLEGPDFAVHGDVFGLGWGVTRLRGGFEAVTLTTLTPISGEVTDVRSAFLVKRAAVADLRLRGLVEEHARGLEQDIPIWEHKRYRAEPLLCENDGPIGEFRKWASQFYPE